ncbi:MAG: hypothetical protein ACNA8K_06085 [Cyclonatronaceae bacterium]
MSVRNSLLSLIALVFLIQCDNPPGPSDYFSDVASLTAFEITPGRVEFDRSVGAVDTTLSIQLSVSLTSGFTTSPAPDYQIIDNTTGNIVRQGQFSDFLEQSYSWSQIVLIETQTTVIREFSVYAWLSDESGSRLSAVQGKFNIVGFSTSPPEILWVENPDSVQIPATGSVSIDFQAKVFHPDGQGNISRVLIDLIDNTGSTLNGSPFDLFDDGRLEESGDAVAGDSVYTRRFAIGASNQPDELTVRYHALDRFGASSDTVSSNLVIWR